ncbi:protein of unknown function [Candidatus Filomicrobium marinum]|uniref:Uncharacterized protein n=1 Tax=Candidatus Filomicrobium marinum TaxID=1608628 RepID=A0A0D6JKU6_9HYPH|nr:protein of unknown function [Candidatus Filomicrobium marinum]CPR22317.1 protein of unknown function [Candidatus Filomicrobium marinum]
MNSVRFLGGQFQNTDIDKITSSSLDLIVVDHALGDPGFVVANAHDVES